MSILSEFREFAIKGNMMDMAIGVIIGGAFGKIIDSLVKDVIMPLISVITGDVFIGNKKTNDKIFYTLFLCQPY